MYNYIITYNFKQLKTAGKITKMSCPMGQLTIEFTFQAKFVTYIASFQCYFAEAERLPPPLIKESRNLWSFQFHMEMLNSFLQVYADISLLFLF